MNASTSRWNDGLTYKDMALANILNAFREHAYLSKQGAHYCTGSIANSPKSIRFPENRKIRVTVTSDNVFVAVRTGKQWTDWTDVDWTVGKDGRE